MKMRKPPSRAEGPLSRSEAEALLDSIDDQAREFLECSRLLIIEGDPDCLANRQDFPREFVAGRARDAARQLEGDLARLLRGDDLAVLNLADDYVANAEANIGLHWLALLIKMLLGRWAVKTLPSIRPNELKALREAIGLLAERRHPFILPLHASRPRR